MSEPYYLRDLILHIVHMNGAISADDLVDVIAKDAQRQARRHVQRLLDEGKLRLGERMKLVLSGNAP